MCSLRRDIAFRLSAAGICIGGRHLTKISLSERSQPDSYAVGQDAVLSNTEKVLIRDSWNKFLAQDTVLSGLFFERLTTYAPELEVAFGNVAARAPVEFLNLFDLAIRGLDATTEDTLREAYHRAPAARTAQCKTLADCGAFFATYGMDQQAWEAARAAFLWTFTKAAYLEDYERTNLALGEDSAFARFFLLHVEAPMNKIREAQDTALSPAVVTRMRAGAEAMMMHPQEAGVFFYKTLFETAPDLIRLFRTADMDALSRHLIDTIVFLSQAADNCSGMRDELRDLARVHQINQIPASEYGQLAGPLLETLSRFGHPLDDAMAQGWQVLFDRVARIISEPMVHQEYMLSEAQQFLSQVADELDWSSARTRKRLTEVAREIRATGTYTHTSEELDYGAKLAWRNAPKCIGRISWKNLIVRDLRHVNDATSIYDACVQHLRTATNGGNIEIVLSVFRPLAPGERWGPRLWNSQLVRYAGYDMGDGTKRGDGANIELTDAIMKLGWTPPEPRGDYDILPLVIDLPGDSPRIFPLAAEEVLEVPITHPTEPRFAELGLKWCAVPAISNFHLEIGGVVYGCAPFNGWFMGTEIARDLWEPGRYDRALDIARALGLDTTSERTLWRDRAFLELNVAILHSFQHAHVTLVDHQTASRQFLIHDQREKRAGRECPAQGSWIVPAAGGSTTPVWHHEMRDFHLKPTYKYAPDRWLAHVDEGFASTAEVNVAALSRTEQPLILYASETGTAESYAHQLARRLDRLAPSVKSMDQVGLQDIECASRVLAIVATCRDGDVPESGLALLAALTAAPSHALSGTSFAVLGLGNRIYPNFCRAAHRIDHAFALAGAERLATLETADEISGQAETVKRWIDVFAKRWDTQAPARSKSRSFYELIPPQQETTPDACQLGTISFNREMLNGSSATATRDDRSTRLIGIDLPDALLRKSESETHAYETGDHVAIWPQNPDDLVKRLCAHLGLPEDGWFRAHGTSSEALDRFRDGYSIWKLLSEDLDLSLPQTPEELLAAMHDKGGDGQERLAGWLRILNHEDDEAKRQDLLTRLRQDFLTVADLFDSFPENVPEFELLIQLLPKLKQRLYSIASSPHAHPQQIRIMVSVLSVPKPNGIMDYGVASHYLAGQAPGAKVRMAIKPAPRRLPDSPDGPVIMIAAGTGIAPLFAALEDRAALGVSASSARPVALYFGCRNEGEFLERAQMLKWRAEGILSRLNVAFSRAGPDKAYVQDALDADGVRVAKDLAHPACHVMICGDATMALEVEQRILGILQRDAGLSYSGARDLLERMRDEGRFIGDVWGIQMNFDVAVPAMIDARYNRGAKWLATLKRSIARYPTKSESIRSY